MELSFHGALNEITVNSSSSFHRIQLTVSRLIRTGVLSEALVHSTHCATLFPFLPLVIRDPKPRP